MKIANAGGVISLKTFDPTRPGEVEPGNIYHLNSVHAGEDGLFVAGRKMPAVVKMTDAAIEVAAAVPRGTHNAQPFEGGVLYNDGDGDAVVFVSEFPQAKLPADPAGKWSCTTLTLGGQLVGVRKFEVLTKDGASTETSPAPGSGSAVKPGSGSAPGSGSGSSG